MRPFRGPETLSAVISHRRELGLLAIAAMVMPVIEWAWMADHGNFNDFHDYWLAGKLVLAGQSPYDVQALRDLARAEHLSFLVGGGYSYPLPFAIFMVPFALLPFSVSLAVFQGLSIVLFASTVAVWIGWAHGWTPNLARRRLLLALAAGFYPPIFGTVASGQANLMLFPLLAGGVALTISGTAPRRQAIGGVMLGLAAIVKLVPGILVVPLVIGRRWGGAVGTALGALGALVVATLLAPWAAQGSGGLTSLLEPDSYFTNQSINGFVTRLVNHSDRTVPLFPHAFDPRLPMLLLTALFGLVTLAILWRARGSLTERRGLALGLALALVAGVIGAPKNSFWNQAFALIAVGLMLAVDAVDLRIRSLGRADLILLSVWLGGAFLWTLLWMFPPSKTGALPALVTLAESSSLYGMLALWLVLARRLAMPFAATEVADVAPPVAGMGVAPAPLRGSPNLRFSNASSRKCLSRSLRPASRPGPRKSERGIGGNGFVRPPGRAALGPDSA